jgi:hypothetical protein
MQLFAQSLKDHNNNVLVAIGGHNGWQPGMTYDDAVRMKHQGWCAAQNNLDYITQFVNGWLQDKNGYAIGQYCESHA